MPEAVENVIECRDLVCGYDGVPVVSDVDLTVRRGEVVTILGGSGSGKSTILKTIVGLLPPISGEVLLFGEDVYAMEPNVRERLLRRTGMLFQQDALFASLSVIQNVMLPLQELTKLPAAVMREIARMKLRLVDLSGLEERQPAEISGGQRKRAALARTSVLDPDVLFCDEPTSGLDPVVAAKVDNTLLRFRSILNITIVAVTHDLGTIHTISDRAVMVGDGRLCAEGSVAELEASQDPLVHAFFKREPTLEEDGRW